MNENEMINYGAQIIAQALDKPDVIKFNDIGLREMSQIIEDMNKGVMKALYDEGYRKVSDDEIVIKKSEYEILLKDYTTTYGNAYQWGLKVGEEKTAIEILHKIKDYIENSVSGYLLIDRKGIRELANELGIELED